MYSTSRVTSIDSISVVSSLTCGGMVYSLRCGRHWATGNSSLQVAVHEIQLLQPAQALANVLRPDLPHALDRLELRVAGGRQLVEPLKLVDDLGDHQFGQPWDAP